MALGVIILLLQALPFFSHRWVEDESWYSIPAYTLLREGRLRNPTFPHTDWESRVDTRPPLTPLALSLSYRVFGIGPTQGRLPAVLAGIGTVVATGVLGTQIGGPAAGAASAIVVATDSFLLVASRTARPEAIIAFFTVLSAALYFAGTKKQSLIWTVLAGVASGLAVLTHVTGLAVPVAVGLLILRRDRWRVWHSARSWVFAMGVVLTVSPFLVWTQSTAVRRAAAASMYGRGEHVPTMVKLVGERQRYDDFLGVGSTRVPIPIPVPVRTHIVLAFVLSLLLLVRYRRGLAGTFLLLLLPHLVLWIYLVNKTSRYFADVAPILAVGLAVAAVELWRVRGWGRTGFTLLAASCVLTQIAGNGWFVYQSRKADYEAVGRELRHIVPPGRAAFGSIVFAVALNDREYASYDRTSLKEAREEFRTEYFIVNDRVMVHGQGYGADDWLLLRRELRPYLSRCGQLVGRVSSPFYGDLEVIRVPDLACAPPAG